MMKKLLDLLNFEVLRLPPVGRCGPAAPTQKNRGLLIKEKATSCCSSPMTIDH